MSERARKLLAVALALPPDERAELVEALLDSLPNDRLDQWSTELERRARAAHADPKGNRVGGGGTAAPFTAYIALIARRDRLPPHARPHRHHCRVPLPTARKLGMDDGSPHPGQVTWAAWPPPMMRSTSSTSTRCSTALS